MTLPGNEGKKAAAVQSKARFKMKIIPGMRLDLDAELDSYVRGLAKGRVKGTVDGKEACNLEITAAIPEIMNAFMPK